ncbi:unnamed protein product [Toxocara canis]|uniref:Macro domain-containing protein n=1 Tax=Toxocara canis TaxID=6265 RepID=A0A183VG03_TOXCA|nr:unnamed protein product [Toxocara canis]
MDFCRRPSINASRRYVSDYHLDYGDMPDGGIRSTAESVSVTNVDQQIGAANKVILPAVNGADFVSVSSGLPIPFDQGNNNDVVKRAQACMDFMEEPQVNTAVRLSRAPSARSVRSSVNILYPINFVS